MRILIVGAGGHAQVVADIILQGQRLGKPTELVGFIDDDPGKLGARILDSPVRGTVADIPKIPHDALIVAIGNNAVRKRLYDQFTTDGEQLATVIHPKAIIAPDVTIGQGTMIIAGAIINTGSTIGANCIINTGATVDHHNQIGDHVHIAPGVNLGGEVAVAHECFIGIGSTVLPRCTIGHGATVGGGALVQRNVAPHQTVIGVPAKAKVKREN